MGQFATHENAPRKLDHRCRVGGCGCPQPSRVLRPGLDRLPALYAVRHACVSNDRPLSVEGHRTLNELEPRRATRAPDLIVGLSFAPLRHVHNGHASQSKTSSSNTAAGVSKKEVVVVKRRPLGPHGSFKTGQRVPFTGDYADQYGLVSHHDAGTTFPPCIGRKGECANRRPVGKAAATA